MIVAFDRARRAPATRLSPEEEADRRRSRAAHPSASSGPCRPVRPNGPVPAEAAIPKSIPALYLVTEKAS